MKKNGLKKKAIVLLMALFMGICSTSIYAGGGGESLSITKTETPPKTGPGETGSKNSEVSKIQQIISWFHSLFGGGDSNSGGGSGSSPSKTAEQNNQKEQAAVESEGKELTALTTGDPVLLTTGQYFQSETDIALKTLSGGLAVNRYHTSGGATGSGMLGSKWTGSLEARLIRGVTEGYQQGKRELESKLAELKQARKDLDEEIVKTDGSLEKEDADIVAEADLMIARAEAEIAALNAIEAKKEKLEALNKYAKYGKITEHAATGNDTLILMLDGYIPVVFEYKGSGKWEACAEKYRTEYELVSGNGKDALEADRFMLKAKNGMKETFDRWGLAASIEDRNGNITAFVRDEEKKLTEIKSPCGVQSLKFSYNRDGLLEKTELEEKGKGTGVCVTYKYTGKLLSAVKDTDGDTQKFEYNADGNLVKLIKPDGSFVEFKYGLTDSEGNLYTTSTVNEEGYAEQFDYEKSSKTTVYTDHDGVRTVYKYDEAHQITEQKEADGTVYAYTYDRAGRMLSGTKNGSKTTFAYDEKGNLLKAVYADGSSETFVYDANNNCIKVTDRDGISAEYTYDARGNCTGIRRGSIEALTAQYNEKGQVTYMTRNGGDRLCRTLFSYDEKGNLKERTTYSKGEAVKESWTYDVQNRVKSYTDGEGQKYTYEYTQKTVTEKTPAGLERVYVTNARKDLESIEETDIKTGEKRYYRYEYDRRHLVTEVKAGRSAEDAETVAAYAYTRAGKAQSETRTDESGSWITEYVYDAAGRIESVKRSKTDRYGNSHKQPVTQKYEYAAAAGGSEFTYISPEGNRTVISHDRWNRVTDVKNALNEKSHRTLSSAGRILNEESSHGGIYSYAYDRTGSLAALGEKNGKQAKIEYNPDGSVKSVTDRNGSVTEFEYDERGLLIKEKSESSAKSYEYDRAGRIKAVYAGKRSGELTKLNAVQYAEYEYAADGRSVKLTAGGLYKAEYKLNAWGEVTETVNGEGDTRKYEHDVLGRTKAAYDGYGEKTECEYNAIGRVSRITAPDGTKTEYEYNELYLVTKVTDGEGVSFEGTYDRDGRLVAEKARPGINREYKYDRLGRITEVKTGGEVTEKYSYGARGRTVTFRDGKGSDYVYKYDEYGRLTQEKNRLDGTQNYFYNENAELKAKKDFEGNVTEIFYDEKTRTKRIKYADGTESVTVYDECGNIASASNENGTLSYVYDKAGLLIKETDEKTGESIIYGYDSAGRRTRLLSGRRNILYEYGRNGELKFEEDRAQTLQVSYKYDRLGRETERRFGNGTRRLTSYDKAGRTVCMKQVNASDRLLAGEAYVYDSEGRRSLSVNEKGLVTVYKYDAQSRLETVYYPFSEELKETARKEAELQGLYFVPSQGNGENYFISSGEMAALKTAAEKIAWGRSGSINVNQIVWKESYTYDANGNRTSKTTPWGTVAYSYDAENRLVESGELGKSESVKYTYDKNGNLLSEIAARYRKDYVYNAQNRMIFSDVQDAFLNTRNLTEYAYDAFGRRIETIEYLGDSTRNLYDGFSFDVVGKTLLQTRSAPAMTEQKYRAGTGVAGAASAAGHPELGSGSAAGRSGAGVANGTRYRYIGDENLVPLENAGGGNTAAQASTTSTAAAKTRSRPNSEYVLYAYGEPVAMSADGDTSYFGTDILGSVRSVTDKYGAVVANYEYDAFGTPYLANLENDVGFGYCGKVYDSATGLYDYGFRDYSPNSARFTTIDPVRDGNNWFAYVVNDPVNFIDPFGLTPSDAGNGNSPKITFTSDIIQQTYIGDTQFNFSIDVSKMGSGSVASSNVTFSFGSTSQSSFSSNAANTTSSSQNIAKSSTGLQVLTALKYTGSALLTAAGIMTGNPLFIAGGLVLSQIPTGRVVNRTNYNVAFSPEHGDPGYLKQGSTFIRTDRITTQGLSGVTSKGFSFGDYTVQNGGIKPTVGTEIANGIANLGKAFLRDTKLGNYLNKENGIIDTMLGHRITTEPYGVYNNEQVLNNSVTDQNGNHINLHGLSGNLNDFKGKDESGYLEEKTK